MRFARGTFLPYSDLSTFKFDAEVRHAGRRKGPGLFAPGVEVFGQAVEDPEGFAERVVLCFADGVSAQEKRSRFVMTDGTMVRLLTVPFLSIFHSRLRAGRCSPI